jgi:hypothetical protein
MAKPVLKIYKSETAANGDVEFLIRERTSGLATFAYRIWHFIKPNSGTGVRVVPVAGDGTLLQSGLETITVRRVANAKNSLIFEAWDKNRPKNAHPKNHLSDAFFRDF